MAGGGGNQMQQPGGAYGQAVGQDRMRDTFRQNRGDNRMRPNMGGMNPNQPTLQRPIGTMGPGSGMAPMQGQMPQYMNDPRLLAFGQANMYSTLPMPQQQMPQGFERQVMQPQQQMPQSIGTMGPGAGMAPMQGQIPQQDPYAAYRQLLGIPQQQMPQPAMPSQTTAVPGQQQLIPPADPYAAAYEARMKPLLGPTQYQNPEIADYIQSAGSPMQQRMPGQIGTLGPGSRGTPTVGGIGSLASAGMSGMFK